MVVDTRFAVRYANAACVQRFGEVTGLSLDAALGLPSITNLKPLLKRALKGETVSLDDALKAVPATAGRLTAKLAPDYTDDVGVVGMLCVIAEASLGPSTTKRKRKTKSAPEPRDSDLRPINDVLPAVVGHLNADLRFRYLNAAYRRYLGETADGAIGKHIAEVLGEAIFQLRRPYLERALAG